MTSSTSKLIGFEELLPDPCDGTGEDVMSTRFRRKWLKAADLRGQDTTSSTNGTGSQLIGLEELQPEPCDGTGDDVMSKRVRRKWLKGALAGSQTSSNAELQAADYAGFGAWFMDQCRDDQEAQRLFAMWQQGIQPARPRRKLLNPAMLKNIVSAVAQKRLECVTPASKVAEIYTLNKQSQRIVRRKLEACDSVNIGRGTVAFRGPHAETQWLNSTMFCALLEHNELVFPEVTFDLYGEDDSKFYKLLSGIERLRLPEMSAGSMWSNEVVARLIHKNQRSLKVLEMPMELLLFSLLPPGLKLEEFITRAHPYDFKAYRTLETKVFKSKCGFGRVPPAFLRSVNADEVYLEVCNMWPNAVDPPTSQPPNSRVKKLAVDVVSVEFNDFYFDRIVRDVYAMCPTLECFEWLSTFRKPSWASSSALFRGEVDSLTARFEQEVEKCTAPFTIFLKASFQYTAKSREEVSDLARRCFDVDLPPACSVHGRREHYHLVKETRFDKKSLHMDFSISVIPPN